LLTGGFDTGFALLNHRFSLSIQVLAPELTRAYNLYQGNYPTNGGQGMVLIEKCIVPANTLLAKYSTDGTYTDCYAAEIPGRISFSEFVFAFYTTLLFKLERLVLKWTVSKPSTDTQARQLAENGTEKFAAWQVESRSESEILMCDFRGRTRSWLMVAPVSTVSGARTRLYFGSAVVPIPGKQSLEFGFQALLLGFHQIYSVLLLYSAKSRLKHLIKKENS
jgi:hypothetical protein